MNWELNDGDRFRLMCCQLERFGQALPDMKGCVLSLTLDNRLLIIGGEPEVTWLLENTAELRYQAWLVLGVEALEIYREQTRVYRAPTFPLSAWEWGKSFKLKKKYSQGTPTMATATLEKPTSTSASAQNGKQQATTKIMAALPVLDMEIDTIATQNGLQPDYVANQIASSGGMVAKVGGVFVTSQDDWSGFVDRYLAQIRDGLLGVATKPAAKPAVAKTAGKIETKAKPAAKATPTKGKAAAKTENKAETSSATRFKSFKLSNSYSRTLGAFLDAQKWEQSQRIEVVEAIANLPAQPTRGEEDSLAEQAVKRIIGVYPAAKRRGNTLRQGLIEAAKGMMGTLEETAETV